MMPTLYEVVTFEPLHNLHFGISKVEKETISDNLLSDTILTNLEHTAKK